MAVSKQSLSRRLLIAALALFVLLGFGIDWWRKRAAAPPAANAARLTSGGFSTEPAISPDGKLVAYASDRGGRTLDIWVQPARGGEPRRITTGTVDSHSPSFSGDGASIAYRSESAGGAAWIVHIKGGAPRRIAEGGRDPRISPDGKWLAYWLRAPEDRDEVWIAPVAGGQPRRLCPDCRTARYPVWSPRGTHILFLANDGQRNDWYAAPLDSGAVTRTGAHSILAIQGFWGDIAPTAWTADGILFTAHSYKSTNVWRMPMSEQLQSTTGARQLTFGSGAESRASAANDGTVVYASSEIKPAVWSLAIDPRHNTAGGTPARLADAAGDRVQPSISADGRRIAWRAGKELRVKDLQTGKETTLNAPDNGEAPPVISPDGTRIAYPSRDRIFSLPFEGAAEPKRIAEHAGSPVAWSADGSRMLAQGWRHAVTMVYTESGERRDIVRAEDTNVYEPRFSPDGRWIAFHTGRPRGGRQVWVVPFHDGPRVKESDWIPITEENGNSRNPCWSADGALLYYLSERDGFRCIWAQHLDRATHRPKGPPFAVAHFHEARYSLTNPRNPLDTGLAASRDKLVFPVFETTGDVWMLRTAR